GVHERRRVRDEAPLRHQVVELLRHFIHRTFAGAVARVCLSDDGGNTPEEIFRLLHGLAFFVLDEVALLENRASVLRERYGAGGWVQWQGHFSFLAVLGRLAERAGFTFSAAVLRTADFWWLRCRVELLLSGNAATG